MTEFAWLIEMVDSNEGPRAIYYGKTGGYSEGLGWIRDANKAIRFSREEDAQAMINANRWATCRPIEHGWDDKC